jgi:hypothetical protein
MNYGSELLVEGKVFEKLTDKWNSRVSEHFTMSDSHTL